MEESCWSVLNPKGLPQTSAIVMQIEYPRLGTNRLDTALVVVVVVALHVDSNHYSCRHSGRHHLVLVA